MAHDPSRSGRAARAGPGRARFTAEAPNQLWVADFTYLRNWAGVAFFSFVIDVFSRMVVGWQFACHMRTTLVLDALRMALGLSTPRGGPGAGASLR